MKKVVAVILCGAAAYAASPTALGFPGAPTAGTPTYNDALGSIISSFYMSGLSGSYALGIFRDSSYVYGLFYPAGSTSLRRFTTAGTVVGSYPLPGSTPRGADYTHLGPGYLCFVDAGTYMVYFVTTTGSTVTSWSYSAGGWAIDIAWTGAPDQYYLVGNYTGGPSSAFYRYTSTGSSAGTWTASGWPSSVTYRGAWTIANYVNNTAGRYLVASSWASGQPSLVVTYPGGSLVGTWSMPASNGNGGCYGDGAPTSYGGTYWVNWYTGSALYAYQVDLGNTTGTSIQPTSFGKLRALYR